MINTAETQPPEASIGRIINAGETIPPESTARGDRSIALLPGESIADSYIINSLLNGQGKQSDTYLAKKWGKEYVVKIYRNGWRPSAQMQGFLMNVSHPNIAPVIECGEHNGCYYEIYEYYSEGTLEETGVLTSKHIQDVIVPSINEGLHELHRNGIVHCDIKPSNLFYSDRGCRVIIGDCGISGYVNSNGKLVNTVRGTPEYAPRVKALLWSAAMSPAYDYGSFGLVLCKAVLGHSIFEGMSVEEISRAWETGLELPSRINGKLGRLICGLLNEDEEQRWGYDEVKRWCEGEYKSSHGRNIYRRPQKEKKSLVFGKFYGETLVVATLHQLEQAIKAHWYQTANIIKRRELIEFVRQFDESIADKIKNLSLIRDENAAIYKLLTYIGDSTQQIYYCGKVYQSLADYVNMLSVGKDETAKKFLSSGLLIFYLRHNDYEKAQVDKLESLIKRSGSNDMTSVLTICIALQSKKTIDVLGVPVESLDSLIPVLRKCPVSKIDELLHDCHFVAWLNRLGYEKEVRNMEKEFT